MSLWDPYDPITYLLHTILGSAGVLAAVVAIASRKGGVSHVRAGWFFSSFAAVAATTAIAFSATQFSPLAIASSLIVLSLVGGAILALRPRTSIVAMGEVVTLVLMVVPACILLAGVILTRLDGAPLGATMLPGAYLLFPAWFLADDYRFMRSSGDQRRSRAHGRHLSRMAFALAIAVHAPVVSFGDRLGIDPIVAFFGPFMLWPLIVFAFRGHPMLADRSRGAS